MVMLSRKAIEAIGFKSIGENVQILDCASFYGAKQITLDNNIRIDDFFVLAAGIRGISIGNYAQIRFIQDIPSMG